MKSNNQKFVQAFEVMPEDVEENGKLLIDWDSLPEVSRVMNTSFNFYGVYSNQGENVSFIKKGNFLKVFMEDEKWLFFEITGVTPNLQTISINALPYPFRVNRNFIENVFISSGNGQMIMKALENGVTFEQDIKYSSDIMTMHQFTAKEVKPLEAIWGGNNGQQNLANLLKGEVDFSTFEISLKQRIGKDSGYRIDFGVNLLALEADINDDSVVNSLYLVGGTPEGDYDEDKDPIVVKYLEVNGVTDKNRRIGKRENSECLTEEDLKKWGNSLFENDRIHEPTATHKVEMAMLEYTEEYQELYGKLNRLHFGDSAFVYIHKLGIELEERMMEYVWYPTLAKFKSITLGSVNKRYTANVQTETKVIQREIKDKSNMLMDAVLNATGWITGNKGGYVRFRPEKAPSEILIMDEPNASEAKEVWRWNLGGLGHSKNGIDGPFDTAITQDGSIVANFITAGILSGILVQGVALKTLDNRDFQVVMEGGKISFEQQVKSTGLNDVHGKSLGNISATYGSTGINGFAIIQSPKNIFSINSGDGKGSSTAIFQIPAESTPENRLYRLYGTGEVNGDLNIKGRLTINGQEVFPGQGGGTGGGSSGGADIFVRVLENTAKYEMGDRSSGYYHEPLNDGAGWNYGKYSFTENYEMVPFLNWLAAEYPDIRSKLEGSPGTGIFNSSWQLFGLANEELFTQVQAEFFCREKLKPMIDWLKKNSGVDFNDGNKWLGTLSLLCSITNWYPAAVQGGFFYRIVQQYSSNWDDRAFITSICDYIVANASSMVGPEYVQGIINRFQSEKIDSINKNEKIMLPFDGINTNQGLKHISSLLGQTIGNGECYALSAEYSGYMGGCGLGAGTKYPITNAIGDTASASDIGSAYDWNKVGWTVIYNPSYSQLKVGAIICWKKGGKVDSWTASDTYGHTGVIRGLSNGRIQTYEQNTELGRIAGERDRPFINSSEISSIIIPPK